MGNGFLRVRGALQNRISLVLAGVLVAVSVIVVGAPAASAAPDYAQIIQNEAAYVAAVQVNSQSCLGTPAYGAIPIAADNPDFVEPYFANYGVRALIAAGGTTYLADAKAWFQWYLDNLNNPTTAQTQANPYDVKGTIYDYTIDSSTCSETSNNTYDSSDAYAGSFLTALGAYSVAPGADITWLQSETPAIDAVAGAIGATLQTNWLTWAEPWTGPPAPYPIEYLMDNVEVYQGLMNYAWLLDGVLGDPSGGAYMTAIAENVDTAITTTILEPTATTGVSAYAYDYATVTPSNWANCYPDSVAQLWPIFAQLGPAALRTNTWNVYKYVWSGVVPATTAWDAATPSTGFTSSTVCGPTAATYAAAVIGDGTAADAAITNLETNWVNYSAGQPVIGLGMHPHPWGVTDSGFLAMAAAIREQQ
jgi:hypothetical protein